MSTHFSELTRQLRRAVGVLVTVQRVEGSGPREVGAWMAVFADAVVNTIGGGHLELQAMAEARALLAQPLVGLAPLHATSHASAAAIADARNVGGDAASLAARAADLVLLQRYALGPSLGQCCGGVVHLRFEPIALGDLPHLQATLQQQAQPVALFGGGHVGRALVRVLGELPFALRWIDSRDEIFPVQLPTNTVCEHADPVQDAVADLAPGAHVLIMSFSHAEDLDVVIACLQRQRAQNDLGFIGLIGSDTKWATFRHRLEARGFTEAELARVTCPIGVPGIAGKQPEVIAVAVAAQLLQQSR